MKDAPVILSREDGEGSQVRSLRSFAVFAAQDDTEKHIHPSSFCLHPFSNTPILRNFLYRSSGSRDGLTFCSSLSPFSRYGARSSAAFAGSLCAPPDGSGTTSSMMASFLR